MKVSELLPPERVREIAESITYICSTEEEKFINKFAIEIARAVLEAAAKRLDDKAHTIWEAWRESGAEQGDCGLAAEAQQCERDAEQLRQMAKEIEP